ncbi:MAG: c-type cytochrome [Planctomycetaceae bacterium]
MPANDAYWRNLRTMHVVFAVSAIALFAATLLMMSADYKDEWRDIQRTSIEIDALKLEQKRNAIVSDPAFQQQVEATQTRIAEADAAVEAKEAELRELDKEIKQQKFLVDVAGSSVRDRRAERDVDRANYDLAVRDSLPQTELDARKAAFDNSQSDVVALEVEWQQRQKDLKLLQEKRDDLTAEQLAANTELLRIQAEATQLDAAITKIEPDEGLQWFKRRLMEVPIIEGFNGHLKPVQDWIPGLYQQLGMTKSARFDRCRTCHAGIDRTEPGNIPTFPLGHPDSDDPHDWVRANEFPNPYASHPNLDLYLSSSSPHPMPRFGCTVCHEGQGSGTSFHNVQHTPDDPHIEHEWKKEYGYFHNHFWEYPMFPKRLNQAMCLKCHHTVVELGINPEFGPTAPKLYEGWDLVKTFGCFGCHEIHGTDGGMPIGPDLRLEPNYTAYSLFARMLLEDPALQDPAEGFDELHRLATEVERHPSDSVTRNKLRELLAAEKTRLAAAAHGDAAGEADDEKSTEEGDDEPAPKLRPSSLALAEQFIDDENPGKMRKVGPSLMHVGSKTTPDFVYHWTEEPKRFRPTTRMPQFFHLTNLQDDLAKRLQPAELAGIATYLMDKSLPLELQQPAEEYQANAERGKTLFAQKGCLACHSHKDFPGAAQEHGPELSRVHEKIKPGSEGFAWLYTWLRNPSHHFPRTRMPNLYLNPEPLGDETIDPAADIAAFLLSAGPTTEFPTPEISDELLDEVVRLNLIKIITKDDTDEVMSTRQFPIRRDLVKGDEIELTREHPAAPLDDEQWRQMKLNYVGRKTISRYGCYGCHDIPGFEQARPIGTALQDWGRKDTSRLAPEHIEEFLHHHGEPDGSSTMELVRDVLKKANNGETMTEEDQDDLRTAFFFDNLLHHGRAGFLWQKLRDPRSYDYKKTETKGYDERLRMPKFPLNEAQIEAISTFVLGLVAEPPSADYLYQPDPQDAARIEGERLIEKYNCTGCHMLELPEYRYNADPEGLLASDLSADEYPAGRDLLLELKPPRQGMTGETTEDGKAVVTFRGLIATRPDPEEDVEDQEYGFDLWETLKAGDKVLFPSSRMLVPAADFDQEGSKPARGGPFAEWLVEHLMETTTQGNRSLAWQAAPPPLYQEGIKVQTPWLYNFLKDPGKLRHTTVLRMPQFNMSSAEAQALANYFAAVDGASFPYQEIPQREPPYLARKEDQLDLSGHPEGEYLTQTWKLLNAPLCIKCHSVGGREVKITDPKTDIRGPNLDLAHDRLRPDWLLLWLYNPKWITPYTSMPAPLARTKQTFPELLEGDGQAQTIGLRDALMNYNRLLEREGKLAYEPPAETPPPADEAEAEQAQAEQAPTEQAGE